MGNITRRWTFTTDSINDTTLSSALKALPYVTTIGGTDTELHVTYRAALRHDWSQARYHDIDAIISQYGGAPTMADVQCYRCSAAITVPVEYAGGREWCDDCIHNAESLEKLV